MENEGKRRGRRGKEEEEKGEGEERGEEEGEGRIITRRTFVTKDTSV